MRACFESEAGIYNYPEWQLNMDIVSRFLMVINSSINIVIYCWSGKQFKAVLVSILTKNEVDYQVCFSEKTYLTRYVLYIQVPCTFVIQFLFRVRHLGLVMTCPNSQKQL